MSEIGAKRILMALGAAFGVRDVKQAPSELDTSSVKVVSNLDPGMMASEAWQSVSAAPISLAGLGTSGWVIVGNESAAAIFDPVRQRLNADKEYVVLGLSVILNYDAAGGAVDAGQINLVQYYRQLIPGATISVESFVEMGIVKSEAESYVHSFPGFLSVRAHTYTGPGDQIEGFASLPMGPLYVPAGSVLGLYIGKRDGGVWPANTTASLYAFGVKCPKGMRPPGM